MAFDQPNYTQLPNQLIALMPDMSDCELRVTLFIARKTFGWHKQRDRLSLSQIMLGTGLSKQGAIDGVTQGMERGTVARFPIGNSFEYELLVNEVDQNARTSQRSRQETVNVVDHSDAKTVNHVDTQKKVHSKEKQKKSISPVSESNELSPSPENAIFGALMTDIQQRVNYLSPRMAEQVGELWDEYPDIDAHIHAMAQTDKYASGFNLKYYEQCLSSWWAKFKKGQNNADESANPESERGLERETTDDGGRNAVGNSRTLRPQSPPRTAAAPILPGIPRQFGAGARRA